MSNDIYDKPTSSLDPFKNVSKEVITDRNELVLQQFLEKQANKKKGIKDEADILLRDGLFDIPDKEYPPVTIKGVVSDET